MIYLSVSPTSEHKHRLPHHLCVHICIAIYHSLSLSFFPQLCFGSETGFFRHFIAPSLSPPPPPFPFPLYDVNTPQLFPLPLPLPQFLRQRLLTTWQPKRLLPASLPYHRRYHQKGSDVSFAQLSPAELIRLSLAAPIVVLNRISNNYLGGTHWSLLLLQSGCGKFELYSTTLFHTVGVVLF